MDVHEALNLKVMDRVLCPRDRGNEAFVGRVVGVGNVSQKNHDGVEFIWVGVQHPTTAARALWPSTRLQKMG